MTDTDGPKVRITNTCEIRFPAVVQTIDRNGTVPVSGRDTAATRPHYVMARVCCGPAPARLPATPYTLANSRCGPVVGPAYHDGNNAWDLGRAEVPEGCRNDGDEAHVIVWTNYLDDDADCYHVQPKNFEVDTGTLARAPGGCCDPVQAVREQTPLPRVYQLSLHVDDVCQQGELFQLGLLRSDSVALEYNVDLAAADRDVWSGCNRGDRYSRWRLTVSRIGIGATRAVLEFHAITEREVAPAITWVAEDWDGKSRNVFVPAPDDGGRPPVYIQPAY